VPNQRAHSRVNRELRAPARPLVILAATSSILGCGLIAYSEPDSGPIARVRFVNDSKGVSGIRQYDDNNCRTGEREVARFSQGLIHNHKSIGIPDDPNIPEGEKAEIRVRAGQPFYGVYWTAAIGSECRIAFEFLPETGRDYQVTFHWDLYKPSCSVTVANVEHVVTSSSRNIKMPPGRCEDALTKTHLF